MPLGGGAAAHRDRDNPLFWTSGSTTTVAIVVVIDLYKTDPYRPHRRWEEGGEWKKRSRNSTACSGWKTYATNGDTVKYSAGTELVAKSPCTGLMLPVPERI